MDQPKDFILIVEFNNDKAHLKINVDVLSKSVEHQSMGPESTTLKKHVTLDNCIEAFMNPE
jgi:ubiquitin C-terminal hydrolase